MPDIHRFDNGIRVHARHLIQVQVDRYAKGPNLHEPVEEQWINKLIGTLGQGPGIFVDIGAAIGYYCFLVHQLNAKVELHAYEPEGPNRERMRENMALNGDAPVRIHDEAVGAMAGTGTLVGEGFVGFLAPEGSGIDGSMVATTTIDHIAAAHNGGIDLLKMDIQGGEAEALVGAQQALRDRTVRNWVVGTHSPPLHAFCLDQLRRHSHRIIFESMRVDHQPDGMIIAATGKR